MMGWLKQNISGLLDHPGGARPARPKVVAPAVVHGILVSDEPHSLPQVPAAMCIEMERTCKVIWTSALSAAPYVPPNGIPPRASYYPVVAKLWEHLNNATRFVAVHLYMGLPLIRGPSFGVTPESSGPLPPAAPAPSGAGLEALSPLVPASTMTHGQSASRPNVHLAPTLVITTQYQTPAATPPSQPSTEPLPEAEPMEVRAASPGPPVLTLERPELHSLEAFLADFFRDKADPPSLTSSVGTEPIDPVSPESSHPPALAISEVAHPQPTAPSGADTTQRELMQDKPQQDSDGGTSTHPGEGWPLFEPVTPVGSPMAEDVPTPQPQPTSYVVSPLGEHMPLILNPDELTVIDSWEATGEDASSPGPSDTKDPTPGQDDLIELDYKADVLSVDLGDNKDWLKP